MKDFKVKITIPIGDEKPAAEKPAPKKHAPIIQGLDVVCIKCNKILGSQEQDKSCEGKSPADE